MGGVCSPEQAVIATMKVAVTATVSSWAIVRVFFEAVDVYRFIRGILRVICMDIVRLLGGAFALWGVLVSTLT